MKNRSLTMVASICVLLLLSGAGSAATLGNITTIADLSGAAYGNVWPDSSVAINNGGVVTWMTGEMTYGSGYVSGGTWAGSGGSATLIARQSSVNTSNSYVNYGVRPGINDSNTVLVPNTAYSTGGGTSGFAQWTGSGGAIGRLYVEHYPNNSTDPYIGVNSAGINNAGYIAFDGRGPGGSRPMGVYYGDGTTTTTIADTTTNGGMFSGRLDAAGYSTQTFQAAGVNNSGQVAFRARLAAGSEGLYVGNGAGLTQIASTAAGVFTGFGDKNGNDCGRSRGISMDQYGDVAYQAVLANGNEAIYYYDALGKTSRLIAQTGTGPGDFTKFYSVSLNDNGVIAFHDEKRNVVTVGTVTTTTYDQGIHVYDPVNGAISKLVANGDTFHDPIRGDLTVFVDNTGSTRLQFGDHALNNQDQIAVDLTFSKVCPLPGGGQLFHLNEVYRASIVGLTPQTPGDSNHDGLVDDNDLNLLLTNWGRSGLGDLNRDNTVDDNDLNILLTHWSPVAAVPEPVALSFLVLGVMAILRRTRT